ncbi:MAG: leucine-rich repeat domain-containing protein [Candidatus Moeniiplasma glomeromycotorum]|nr:leucine-rich repeat domain-containing protein [Candidatus Moeniiplasma glomeromycotorum]MCE8169369.1 leucine-rich repeat domain-containing protein [Candidatus Moeniiplasma glomeromycotorum]
MPKALQYLNQHHLSEERETITELNLNKQNLTGHLNLREFINLEILEANYNQLTSIDFSNCPKLKEVSVLGNKLTSLYLSRQPQLKSLICADNQLNFLDLNGNKELKHLFAYDNFFTNLEFLNQLECPEKLKRMDICNNKFTPISLTYFQFFPNLKTLLIANNPFYGTVEDIENLTKLSWSSFDNTEIEIVLENKVEISLSRNK